MTCDNALITTTKYLYATVLLRRHHLYELNHLVTLIKNQLKLKLLMCVPATLVKQVLFLVVLYVILHL